MSTQRTSLVESKHLAAGPCKMLAHQTHSKGSIEYAGITRALIFSTTMVLLSALAVAACNQPAASFSMKENSVSATATAAAGAAAAAQKSLKARESAYFQHKELGSIFAETQDPK